MSDLFHKDVPVRLYPISVFDTMMDATPQHTYQVLTKRPERMAQYDPQTVLPVMTLRRLSTSGVARRSRIKSEPTNRIPALAVYVPAKCALPEL
jgi:protein gp37